MIWKNPPFTFWNTIILLAGIWILSWWNSHLVLQDIERKRAAYVVQYQSDVDQANKRTSDLAKLVQEVKEHGDLMRAVLRKVDTSEGSWRSESRKDILQIKTDIHKIMLAQPATRP